MLNNIHRLVICLGIIILLPLRVQSEDNVNLISYSDPSTCLLSNNETFSTTRLDCVKCNWQWDLSTEKDVKPPASLGTDARRRYTNCRCPIGYFNVLDRLCRPCVNGSVSEDGTTCLLCTDTNPFNSSSGKCESCPSGHVIGLRDSDGRKHELFTCIQCAHGFTPSSSSAETCIPCHPTYPAHGFQNGLCTCPNGFTLNGICVSNSSEFPEKDAGRTNLFKLQPDSKSGSESKFLRDQVLLSTFLCRIGNESACQLIANACTLQFYANGNREAPTTCNFHDTLLETSSNDITPRLTYKENFQLLQFSSAISQQFTTDFNDPSSDVNITVARYGLDGSFRGLFQLSDLLPCQGQTEARRMTRKFGANIKIACEIHIKDLWDHYNGQTEFFEPFLSIERKPNQTLYSVPIRILNTHRLADSTEKLRRRFFLIDTIGGIENSGDSDTKDVNQDFQIPNVIRFVDKICITIELKNVESSGRITVPIIQLHYNQITRDEFAGNHLVHFSYEMEYFMDMTRATEDIKISVGVLSSLAVVWAAFQTWSWNRRNGRAEIDLQTILTLVLTSCGYIADAFFIVCFVTGSYWWIFFKNQVAVHVLLPLPAQERLIIDLLISSFSLKTVDVLLLIWHQISIDIFLIDWERPKLGSIIQPPVSQQKADPNSAKSSAAVPENATDMKQCISIWRSYFVANEWNEIQSTRKIHLATHIILTLLFVEVFGFKYLGLNWPLSIIKPGVKATNIPYSTVARFIIATITLVILGLIQWLYAVGIYERFFSNKVQDFVDICSMANISVFILSARQQGFYIHGRSVHGFADTDMRTMVEQLSREEEDLCGRRGLVPTYDQQTFLISVPRSFRTVYDQVLQPVYASSAILGRGRQAKLTEPKKGSSKPNSGQFKLSSNAYHSMNRFLTSFLEHAISDIDYDVCDKSFIETTFDMEFRGSEGGDRAVFYNDNGHSFDAVLFYGNEQTLFLFDLYLFVFVDLLSHNMVLAGIITFLTDMLIKYVRNFLGKRNIARKTLIDERFLI